MCLANQIEDWQTLRSDGLGLLSGVLQMTELGWDSLRSDSF